MIPNEFNGLNVLVIYFLIDAIFTIFSHSFVYPNFSIIDGHADELYVLYLFICKYFYFLLLLYSLIFIFD